MKRLYFIGALALVLQSCTSLQITPTPRIEGKVKLTVESRVEGSTKSQYNPDESRIKDLNLFIFDDKGVLLASRFEDSNPGSITMELELAEDYSIRAVANYVRATYGIEVDKSGKDISRACFLPFDSKAYINPNLK